jgi:coproporphyrinogen III oxidase-like Fe-S oxidoreductase
MTSNFCATLKIRKPDDYLARTNSYTASCKNIPADELPLGFMMNTMRLNAGVPSELFSERTCIPLEEIRPALDKLLEQGLIDQQTTHLKPTQKGHQFLNNLLEIFNA